MWVQLIVLSASANKLSKLKEQAEEYAALIMEELDPENLGYIEVNYNIHYAPQFLPFSILPRPCDKKLNLFWLSARLILNWEFLDMP